MTAAAERAARAIAEAIRGNSGELSNAAIGLAEDGAAGEVEVFVKETAPIIDREVGLPHNCAATEKTIRALRAQVEELKAALRNTARVVGIERQPPR